MVRSAKKSLLNLQKIIHKAYCQKYFLSGQVDRSKEELKDESYISILNRVGECMTRLTAEYLTTQITRDTLCAKINN